MRDLGIKMRGESAGSIYEESTLPSHHRCWGESQNDKEGADRGNSEKQSESLSTIALLEE